MKTTIAITLIIAIAGRVLADEIKAWVSWLSKKLRRTAVRKLPIHLRERYDEEWESAVEEVPGDIAKLAYSFGLLRAGVVIRREFEHQIGSELALIIKRTFDLTLASLILVGIFPLLFLIAITIKLTSSGPAFYLSDRVGRGGRIFKVITFRTMALDPDGRVERFAEFKSLDGVVHKLFLRPVITPIGRFLRKYSLDELPQVFNVLKGDMSIVGPRPPMCSEVRNDNPEHLRRLDAMPGITRNWNIWPDVKVILRTIAVEFSGRANLARRHNHDNHEDSQSEE